MLAKPGNQLAVPLRSGWAGLPQCQRANARVHLVLGDIDAHDNEIVLCHHPLPSLLGTGSKPLQLFGLRKTPELSLALIQAYRFWGVTGSVPATGGFARTARSHILPDFLDTRGASRSSRTLAAGCDGRVDAQDERGQGGRRNRVVLTPRRWCQVSRGVSRE